MVKAPNEARIATYGYVTCGPVRGRIIPTGVWDERRRAGDKFTADGGSDAGAVSGRAGRRGESHQPWRIRIWRGLSWLERAEQAGDPEGRLISLWIAFNSIYGHEDDASRPASDRASWQSFLASVFKLDKPDRFGSVLREQASAVRRLIDGKYLFRPFWQGHEDWQAKHRKAEIAAFFRSHSD